VPLDWLTRKAADQLDVSRITFRRLKKRWAGRRPGKRKCSIDAMREQDMVEAVRNCPCVCSVWTSGLANEAGKLKSASLVQPAPRSSLLEGSIFTKRSAVSTRHRTLRRSKIFSASISSVRLSASSARLMRSLAFASSNAEVSDAIPRPWGFVVSMGF
jgi:hypothetical protein